MAPNVQNRNRMFCYWVYSWRYNIVMYYGLFKREYSGNICTN